jgi:hypothetical protein
VVALLSAVVLASALAGMVASVAAPDRPAWALFGFEFVTGVAGVLGVIMGWGRFREAPGMALACIAATVLVAAALGYKSLQPPVLGGVSLRPFLLGRAACAVLLAATGAYCVLSRNPRSWPMFFKGVALAMPLAAAAGVAAVPAARALVASMVGSSLLATIVSAVAAFVVLGVLACASAHLIIRAFELGCDDHDPARS